MAYMLVNFYYYCRCVQKSKQIIVGNGRHISEECDDLYQFVLLIIIITDR